MKIAVAGTGYVGLSNAVLLAQHHEVVALDIIPEKVVLINQKKSPTFDAEIEDFLTNRELNLKATTDKQEPFAGAEYVVIANCRSDELTDVDEKIYTCDLFGNDY